MEHTWLLPLLLLIAPVVRAEPGVSDREIVVGSCGNLSGENMISGMNYVGGAKAYFDYLNREKGGVHGRKVKLVSRDDQFDAEKAIDCYNHLLNEPVFITGLSMGSPTGAKYVVMAEEKHVPFVALMAGPAFMYGNRKYVFATRAPTSAETSGEIHHLWDDLGMRKIAVIYENDALGSSAFRSIQEELARKGASAVTVASYDLTSSGVGAAYDSTKAARPDAVIFAGLSSRLAQLLKRAKSDHWRPLFLAIAIRESSLIYEAGADADGVVVTETVPLANETGYPTVVLYRRVLRKYAPKLSLGNLSLQGFVDAMIISEGLKRSGKDPTREGFVSAMESLGDFDAGLGPEYAVHLAPGHHAAFDNVSFAVIRGGKVVALKDWRRLERASK